MSALLFESTRRWPRFSQARNVDPRFVEKRKQELHLAFTEYGYKFPGDGNDCSTIARLLNRQENSGFYWFDVNGDSKDEIVYNGQAFCSEGSIFGIWELIDDVFRFLGSGSDLLLRVSGGKSPSVSKYRRACCGGTFDTYYLGLLFENTVEAEINIHINTVEPTSGYIADSSFSAPAGIQLRSSPIVDDKFDERASGLEMQEVFGNLIAKYDVKATGRAIASRTDANGKRWWFVVVDPASQRYKLYDLNSISVGWATALDVQAPP